MLAALFRTSIFVRLRVDSVIGRFFFSQGVTVIFLLSAVERYIIEWISFNSFIGCMKNTEAINKGIPS